MQTVPDMTVTHMGAAATICFIAPFLVLMAYKRNSPKTKVGRPTVYGVILYLAFGGALLQMFHTLFLGISPALSETILGSPWIYTIYGGLTSSLIETFARWFGFKLLSKEPMDTSTGTLFGVGFGGAGLVMNGAITLLNTMMMATSINAMGVDSLLTEAGDMAGTVQATIDALLHTEAIVYYISALEQILFFGLQVALSILTYCAFVRTEARFLLPVTAVLHLMTGILTGLYQNGIIADINIMLALVAGYTLIVAVFTRIMYRRYSK